jgi:hypothetical protein
MSSMIIRVMIDNVAAAAETTASVVAAGIKPDRALRL